MTVILDGKSLGTFKPTSRVRIHGGGGNDTITVSHGVTAAVWLYADGGNVQFQGGGGPTLLVGGSGKNTFTGGSGRTIMIGGSGADSLTGGNGDAILIGGTTAYDAIPVALRAVLSTWSSPASYAARVSQIESNHLSRRISNRAIPKMVAPIFATGPTAAGPWKGYGQCIGYNDTGVPRHE